MGNLGESWYACVYVCLRAFVPTLEGPGCWLKTHVLSVVGKGLALEWAL